MDNFINLAKQGMQAYQNSQNSDQNQNQGQNQYQQQGGQQDYQQQGGQNYQQGGQDYQGGQQGGYQGGQQGQGQDQQYSVQGGSQWNAPDHQNAPGVQLNQHEIVNQASNFAGDSGDSNLFSQAMSFINNNSQEHTQPVDEQGVQQAHQQAYGQGNASNLDAGGIGGAAALQVLKQFTSGGGGQGTSQSTLVSMAMSEASKLFDQAGGGAGGSKQDAIQSAGMTIVKLLVQSKFSGAIGGGNSGGLSGLMGMASKFM